MIQIRNRHTNKVICEAETIKAAIKRNHTNLRGSDLSGSDLSGIRTSYQSHDLLAEILRRAAGEDIAKLKVAGLILISRDKCWKDFVQMSKDEPLADWALDELAKWVQPDDGAPAVLRQRAAINEAVLGGVK